MKKLVLLSILLSFSICSFSQIEIKPKPEDQRNILITSDFMIGLPHLIKCSFDYYQDLFAFGVSTGISGADFHLGMRLFTFNKGQISILGAYGISPWGQELTSNGSRYKGGFIDIILVKHLKINLGAVTFSNTKTKLLPYVNIGYCFNLYKNK